MPAISKIRFTNIVYEQGAKRYNDSVFYFDGHNGAIVLENGGGKTVFIQTAIQAVLPRADVAGRKMKDTLSLENGPAHVAIEWLLAEKPRRRYAVTCVSLFMSTTGLDSMQYVYEYGEHDEHSISKLPFTKESGGKPRVTEKGEIQEYYQSMQQRHSLTARTFDTITGFHEYIERQLHIIPSEWREIVKINSNEGGIEAFFDECKTTSQLVDRLLIPTIEESMEGYKQGTFVDLFQVQREGFKQYKELKEKIEENRRILAELNKYVQGFEQLHLRQTEYTQLQQEAKAYLKHAARQESEQLSEQARLRERAGEWERKHMAWRQKEASLRIERERQQEGALEAALHEIDSDKEQLESQLSDAQRMYHSLQYAEHRERLREAEARLDYINEQLGRLDESQDEQELLRRWQQNGSELRGLFLQEEQRQLELIGQLQNETSEKVERQRELAVEERTANEERVRLLARESELVGERKGMRLQRQEIANKILSNPQSQSVEEQIPLWNDEQRALEEDFLQYQRSLTDGDRRKVKLQQLLEEAQSEQLRVAGELTKCEQQQHLYEREHQTVKQELALLRPTWERIVSLHEKQSTLPDQLADEVERRQLQKTQLLHKERIAYRHVDDYAELSVFFADPGVVRLVEQWGNQFSMLEIGVHYATDVERAEASELWPITLVTTVQEKPLLQRKLSEAADQLQYPIRIMTTQEARSLRTQEDAYVVASESTWVEPAHWQQLQNPKQFVEWKKSVWDKAKEAEQARKRKEYELSQWQDVQKQLQAFLENYPLTEVQELERQLSDLSEYKLRLAATIEQLDKELQLLARQKDDLQEAIQLNRQQVLQLGNYLEQGQQYKRLGEKLRVLEQELYAVQESKLRIEQQLGVWQRRLAELGKELDRKHGELRGAEDKLQRLLDDDLFIEVVDYEPLETEHAMGRLKEERKDLTLQRYQIMKERSTLEADYGSQHEHKIAAEREMQRLLIDYPNLSIDLELPSQLDLKLKEVRGEVQTLEEKLRKLSLELGRQNEELINKRAELKILTEQFTDTFPDVKPMRFLESLSRVREELDREGKGLNEARTEVDRLQSVATKRLTDINSVLQLWNRYERTHKLDDPLLAGTSLTHEQATELSYHLRERSLVVIEKLEHHNGVINEERSKVSRNRSRFKDFCNRQVQDVKLREMAERGVDLKESYAELQEFESMMAASILKANHYAELRMQTEDQKLQQYIAHIQMHLKQIASELKDLPKKTRVRTEMGNKEIYAFHVPEWEEQEGKERIRLHIEWIISQLDSTRYRNEQGEEQSASVRKDLEKWLDAKQLLQKVFQQATIRISCRKVTNDQQVTGATYSWEESNRWSGGEKWSKNMTLFLGILNYVAEKRQHIQGQIKRHRTVILDNPFGKASSDHVLSPVFYIAEQLGFQIIALTAHAEGKFLQDYFPVVYSCRLRAAAGNSGKQIVDPQQSIQQAYFQDHAPESMDRIGEAKQMELF